MGEDVHLLGRGTHYQDAGVHSTGNRADNTGEHSPVSRRIQEIATAVVDASYVVHRVLGPGLLESIYERCLFHEIASRGFGCERQVSVPIRFKELVIDEGLRLDLFIERSIIIELKAVEILLPVHQAQLLTYMKLTDTRLGFLINFNVPIIKNGIRRMIL